MITASTFSATITTLARTVDHAQRYPPALGRMRIRYDHSAGLAVVAIEAGVEAGKTYIRQYNQKRDYLVIGGEYPLCRRSYLGDPMPMPALPTQAKLQGSVFIDGTMYQHWQQEDLGGSRIHLYIDSATSLPRRVVEEVAVRDGAALPAPLMTYDMSNVVLGPQDPASFELPAPYTHDTCELYIGGFPYIHAFHHFLRF
ncbi:hypothetical protein JKP88DRAFT_217808 [Tribonema minus]|uniref:Uncharacterized protein n=1 Tax=Tribonema minus TaxID=303371 RepID=A0A836CLG6_9STRA|nr:hypothetical protein JKP88DRAFT_217808 [Tribonema minus]